MAALIAGLAIFFAAHILAAGPARAALTGRLGEGGRKLFVTVFAFIGLGLIIWGKAIAPFSPVYDPPPAGRAIAMHAMPVAFVILAVTYVPGRLRRSLRHPMLLAILIWSGLHLLANGDAASILLFGSFALYVPASVWLAERRGYLPPVAGAWRWDAFAVLVGAVAYFAVFRFHGVLFGPVLAG
ncbi:MAG: NnrU family protein [Euryhalocaulis sp.]|uniref:NnrU family protein n=1 Tax=Euryhalocaulis sp. TaxID=2744307 RepID=UPI0017D7D9FA|nr:NnrU family protein [Euryhalocaulis sp.]MBA4800278.1 NnrU family protein [Euryhalocaulis sp.]